MESATKKRMQILDFRGDSIRVSSFKTINVVRGVNSIWDTMEESMDKEDIKGVKELKLGLMSIDEIDNINSESLIIKIDFKGHHNWVLCHSKWR